VIPFHKLLIGTAVVFCGGFAVWSVWRGSLAVGVAFAVLGAGLGYYLRHLQRFLSR
jgi:hypothetical protein